MRAGPGDVFRHLLTIGALYTSAVSFGVLLFQFIDRWFPDALAPAPYFATGSLRWALASLVIVFPVYVWFSWLVARDISAHPEKRELKSRTWLYHFTVFAAAAVIIGDLVALVYNFLGGELSPRFIGKLAAIFFIAAVVFAYYLWNLRSERMASRDPRMRVFIFGVAAIVALAVVGGFFIAGSPFAERVRRFDDRRVQDLQTLQWQVINYWQRKSGLPPSLEALRDDISGFIPPRDPESGEVYGYQALGKLRFELCAAFKSEGRPSGVSAPVLPEGRAPDSWAHGTGRVCLERTIDPDLYGIEKPVKR